MISAEAPGPLERARVHRSDPLRGQGLSQGLRLALAVLGQRDITCAREPPFAGPGGLPVA